MDNDDIDDFYASPEISSQRRRKYKNSARLGIKGEKITSDRLFVFEYVVMSSGAHIVICKSGILFPYLCGYNHQYNPF